ncbi:hypothetical protein APHAL10511_002950 [Amanita phalloides]|nr:hypothetical protein APHAL10511_002950 [Amanita phalloides]
MANQPSPPSPSTGDAPNGDGELEVTDEEDGTTSLSRLSPVVPHFSEATTCPTPLFWVALLPPSLPSSLNTSTDVEGELLLKRLRLLWSRECQKVAPQSVALLFPFEGRV